MSIGVHVSIAGGVSTAVERALDLGCGALQCFGGNPRGWKQKPLADGEAALFREKRGSSGIDTVAIHTSYLINLSSPDEALYEKSLSLFAVELERAQAIGADYLVTHLGSSRGEGTAFAMGRVKRAFETLRGDLSAAPKVEILFENTAGGGDTTGSDLEVMGEILNSLDRTDMGFGFCFDTCHAFAAGYPLATAKEVEALVSRIKDTVGLERLKLIHLNDSKGKLGSKLDRHEHIGEGMIKTFGPFLRHPAIRGVPLILETPKTTPEDDPRNLKKVRRLRKV